VSDVADARQRHLLRERLPKARQAR
jgi:hypothetical protein